MKSTITDLVNIIETIAPPRLQEQWDNCGLIVGDPQDSVNKVVLALDVSEQAIEFAAKQKAGLLLVHHPPLIRAISKVREDQPTGKLLAMAIRSRVAIYAAHTSFDAVLGGLNDYFCELLGLKNVTPLQACDNDNYFKLVTFVPPEFFEQVATAIFQAGGGVIGQYDSCSFREQGMGSFRPLSGAEPFSGSIGEVSNQKEIRLEVRLPRNLSGRIVKAMIEAHPYDEVAYDLYPVIGGDHWGVGRLGDLAKPMRLSELAQLCKRNLKLPDVRLVEANKKKIRRAAVCTGGGGSLLSNAITSDATVYITGDVNYHQARDAQAAGLSLIDVGHFGSERIFIQAMKKRLHQSLEDKKITITISTFGKEKNPFRTI